MLVEIEGEWVRIFAGLSLRARLVQVLGPVRALRVAQAVARMGGPVLGVDWGRRRFLGRAAKHRFSPPRRRVMPRTWHAQSRMSAAIGWH
jgi:hypothetical protein